MVFHAKAMPLQGNLHNLHKRSYIKVDILERSAQSKGFLLYSWTVMYQVPVITIE